jgi:hypothetical protein
VVSQNNRCDLIGKWVEPAVRGSGYVGFCPTFNGLKQVSGRVFKDTR